MEPALAARYGSAASGPNAVAGRRRLDRWGDPTSGLRAPERKRLGVSEAGNARNERNPRSRNLRADATLKGSASVPDHHWTFRLARR